MGGYLLHHLLDATPREGGDVALAGGGESIDYSGFSARSEALAASLAAVGMRRGDRVGIYLEKGLAECWAIFGVSRADGVFVPINPALRPPQVRHVLSDSGARVLVTSAALLSSLESSLEGLDGLVAVLLMDERPEGTAAPAPIFGWAEPGDGRSVPSSRSIGEDLAAILYTSGSTGLPKGVMLSHRNLLAGTRIVRTYLEITPRERILSILPLSFDYGLNQLLTSVEQGACLIPFSFRFGDQVVAALRDHRITGLAGVPSLWAILTRAAPSLPRTELPHLRYITNSGGAVPVETVKRMRGLLPHVEIFLMYGLTEAFRSTFLPPAEIDARSDSMGKAIPETEVFLVDGEGNLVPPRTPGILVHRGPTVSLGYWNRPEDTARVLRPNPLVPTERGGDTVCYSGDLVEQDEEGFLYFVGRSDAMIKSSGFRISPTEVEGALMSTGFFRQVAVVGLPDPMTGQRVHAVAVPDGDGVDPEAALRVCATQLASYMVPRTIELVEALPIGPTGKVDYKSLVRERQDVGG